MTVLLILLSLRWLPETRPLSESRKTLTQETPKPAWRVLLRLPVFWGYVSQSALHFGAAFLLVAAGPFLVVNILGKSATQFGMVMMFIIASMLIGVLISGRTIKLMSRSLQVFVGSVFFRCGERRLFDFSIAAGVQIYFDGFRRADLLCFSRNWLLVSTEPSRLFEFDTEACGNRIGNCIGNANVDSSGRRAPGFDKFVAA
jgi:hypothetical protein